MVTRVSLYRNTPVTSIRDTCWMLAGGFIDHQSQTGAEFVAIGITRIERNRRSGRIVIDCRPMHGGLGVVEKGSITNQCRVEPAVVAMVDFFSHQSVEPWADFTGRVPGIDRERWTGGEASDQCRADKE